MSSNCQISHDINCLLRKRPTSPNLQRVYPIGYCEKNDLNQKQFDSYIHLHLEYSEKIF